MLGLEGIEPMDVKFLHDSADVLGRAKYRVPGAESSVADVLANQWLSLRIRPLVLSCLEQRTTNTVATSRNAHLNS
jgi:hypothetical protein